MASAESKHSWLISLAFWLCLLTAALLYASVMLAPKLLTNFSLRGQHYGNQVRLVSDEQQQRYLEKVVAALESDPEFAEELARVDFDAVRPGDERIPASEAVNWELLPESASARSAVRDPWYLPSMRILAGHQSLRWSMLSVAALLIVLAFAYLHEGQSRRLGAAAGAAQSLLRGLADRYRTDAADV